MSALTFTFGWTLLHFLWQGTALALIVWILLAVSRRARAELRYALACGGMLLMAAAPVVTFLVLRATEPVPVRTQAVPVASAEAPEAEPQALVPVELTPQRVAPSLRSRLDGVAPRILPVWALGVLLLSLRLAGGLGWLVRARRRSRELEGEWLERVEILRHHFGVTRCIALRVLDELEGPMVTGLLKPVILVPTSVLTGLPATQVELLLAHEIAHITRHDVLANALQRGVETLLFFHPAVWWLGRRVRQERERCCDAMAADFLGDPCGMAEALTSLENLHHLPLFALGATGGSLKERVQALLDLHAPLNRLRLAVAAGLVLVCLGTGVGLWKLRARRQVRRAAAAHQVQGGSLWLKAKGGDPQVEFEVLSTTADAVLAALARAEARRVTEGLSQVQETIARPGKPTPGKPELEAFTVRKQSLPRTQFLEYWNRLKARPPLDLPADALVVRRDNLGLPWDAQEAPPLDVWVPKHAEQFSPEAARLLREAVLELKALPPTPGRPQEARRALPEAILSTLKSPEPGAPVLRSWDAGREEALFKLCHEEPFEPIAGLRYELNHLTVELATPSPGDWKALETAKEAMKQHRATRKWYNARKRGTAKEQQERKDWQDKAHKLQTVIDGLEAGLIRKGLLNGAQLLQRRLAELGAKPATGSTPPARLGIEVGLPPHYSANVSMPSGSKPAGHPRLVVSGLMVDSGLLRTSPTQEIAALQAVEATLQASLRGEHPCANRTLW